MNAPTFSEVSGSSKPDSQYPISREIQPQPTGQYIKPSHRPVDLGYGLIFSTLSEREFESAQIWDSLNTSCNGNTFQDSGNMLMIQPRLSWRTQILTSSFPALGEALKLIDTAFYACFRCHEVIDREQFLQATRTFYNTSHEQDKFPYLDHCVLLAATFALAYAMDAKRHAIFGCESVVNSSIYYLTFAKANLPIKDHSSMSITKLRTAVMIVIFHLNVNNVRFAFDLLLYARDSVSHLDIRNQKSMQTLYWTVLYLDLHVCSLLREPPCFDFSEVKSSLLVVMQRAASNRSRQVRSSQELLLDVGLALALELAHMRIRIANLQLNEKAARPAQKIPIADIRQLERELDDFKVVCDSIFPTGEIVLVIARTRYELLMAYCVTSLMLALQRKWLMREAKVAFIPGDGGIEERSSAAAAILAVDYTTEYGKMPDHAPTAEPSAYALFLNILCLIQEMSATVDHTSHRRFATRILEGFFLMSRMTCQAFAAPPVYLRFIYELGNQCGAIPSLNETVPSFVSQGHQHNKVDVDWTFLPDYQDFNQDLLSVPHLHDMSNSQITPISSHPPSNRISSAMSSQTPSHYSPSSAASSSQVSSRSSVTPSSFTQWSPGQPGLTPISSTLQKPMKSWPNTPSDQNAPTVADQTDRFSISQWDHI